MSGKRASALCIALALSACTALTGLSDITTEGGQNARPREDGGTSLQDAAVAVPSDRDAASKPPDVTDGAPAEASRPGAAGVTCGSTTCAAGQRCCRNGTSVACSATACPIYDYACDDPFDCPADQICCGTEQDALGTLVVVNTRCSSSCAGRVICVTSAECTGSGACERLGVPAPESLKACPR